MTAGPDDATHGSLAVASSITIRLATAQVARAASSVAAWAITTPLAFHATQSVLVQANGTSRAALGMADAAVAPGFMTAFAIMARDQSSMANAFGRLRL